MDFESQLQSIHDAKLFRQTKVLNRRGMTVIDDEGRGLIDFSSNDYLGLSQHPRLIEVAVEATQRYGVGSTASRLISGSTPAHDSCEGFLAQSKDTESALLFATGYMTSMGVIPSVVGPDDVIIMDKLAHASLIDAARVSGARLRVFPHNNLDRLESLLKSERSKLSAEGKILILIESVYSMDGDVALLEQIVALKESHGALLLVDEAHGLGVLGERGLGLAEALGLQSRIDLQMGTLGKAAGGAGGYVACSHVLRDLIVNRGRSLIFTTAPPPSQAAVAQAALELIDSVEGRELRERLRRHCRTVGMTINGEPLPSAICPIIIGQNTPTLELSESLRGQGMLIPAIRYPTVAKGSARLRITLSACHSDDNVDLLLRALAARDT